MKQQNLTLKCYYFLTIENVFVMFNIQVFFNVCQQKHLALQFQEPPKKEKKHRLWTPANSLMVSEAACQRSKGQSKVNLDSKGI